MATMTKKYSSRSGARSTIAHGEGSSTGPADRTTNFAGHDASRGLALNSFDLDIINDWDQPIDPLTDLTTEQIDALDEWQEHFENKYPCIGTLIPEPGVNVKV